MDSQRPPARDAAHVVLRLGRLMLANGADTAHVQQAVTAFAERLGYRVHLLACLEGLLLTFDDDEGFHTRLGPAISGTSVNMGALAALYDIRRRGIAAPTDLKGMDRALDEVEHGGHRYPHWLVAIGMGVTAASLARLFGGVWTVVGVSFLVGVMAQTLRHYLAAAAMNPFATAGLSAFGGGLVGTLAMKAFPETSPALCLVAAGMILVPGVPLLNGVRDTLGNHMGAGIGRLMLGAVTILAITLGLFVAAGLVGDKLTVEGDLPLLPSIEDALFSAFAGAGFVLLFNVPARAAWGCVLCAMAGHGLRTAVEHLGVNISVGCLIGAFAATLVARTLAGHFLSRPSLLPFQGSWR